MDVVSRLIRCCVFIWAALICAASFGQGDRTITKMVLADLLQIPEADRPFVRYLSAPPNPSEDWIHPANIVVNNTVSQARTIVHGAVVGSGYLLRYDLRELAPEERQFKRLVELWDSLAKRDPYYHVSQVYTDQPIKDVAKNAAIIAPHIELIVAQLATEINFSPALVYRYDFFQDQVFQAADTPLGQGLYYDFLQLEQPRKGEREIDAFLRSVGIDYTKVDELGGERRVGMFASNITSRARRIDTYIGNAGRRVWVTQDQKASSSQAKQHPIYSLHRFFPDAKELIAERANGLHIGLLFDRLGNLQATAPPDVARDHTIPIPFPQELTPGISCYRCHGQEGAGGLQPVTNDVARLFSSNFSILGDQVLIDKIRSLYSGERFDIYLGRGRVDHEFATLKVVGNSNIPPDQSVVGLVRDEIAKIWSNYRYKYVNAETALREITGKGYDGDSPANALASAIDYQQEEDPAVVQLLSGGKIRRSDFERIYTLLALRYQRKENEDDN